MRAQTSPIDSVLFSDIIAVEDAVYFTGDTALVFNSGLDTTFILDTLPTALIDTTGIEARIALTALSTDIIIDVSNKNAPINMGLLGVNVSSFFDHLPEDSVNDTTLPQYDMLSALSPKSIRCFDGSGGKFYHPLGSLDENDSTNGGYGLNIKEIIRCFDYTNGSLDFTYPSDVLNAVDFDAINTDMEGMPLYICDDCHLWMEPGYASQFEDLYKQALRQPKYKVSDYASREAQPLFINQFIRLIKKIEAENNNDTVDVIFCLNIITETAEKTKEIIQYMRSNTIHNCNVAGVEMGNEVGAEFFNKTIGYTYFDQYWDYISTDVFNFNLASICPSMIGHHNFIKALKSDRYFHIKIGIPGNNLYGTNPAGQSFAFKENGGCWLGGFPPTLGADYCAIDWNTGLANHFSYTVHVEGTGFSIPAFDAIILHPYYDANDNWDLIPKCIPYDSPLGFPFHTPYSYLTYDERLRCAFDGIAGIGNLFGNFYQFITTRHKESYDEFDKTFHFRTCGKELWQTEMNLKDEGPDDRYKMYDNTFVDCTFLSEWLLSNIKLNFSTKYRGKHFFTYNTIQNFAGGTGIDLLNPGDNEDLAYWKAPGHLLNGIVDVSNYVPRATYFTDSILGEIVRKKLQYLPANFTLHAIHGGAVNLTPTVFVNADKTAIYVYYTNTKNTTQSYVVDCANILSWYIGGYGLWFGSIEASYVQGQQLYSSSGKTGLFLSTLNTYYSANPHPVEIVGTNTSYTNIAACSETILAGSICVTMPPLSEGYFMIPIHVYYDPLAPKIVNKKSNDLILYPNPTTTQFGILQNTETVAVSVFDLAGKLYLTQTIKGAELIDIATLPNGTYNVSIKTNTTEVYKLLIKQ